MTISRAYRYRIYPTGEQEALLVKTFGCVRVLWNRSVATFNSWDPNTNPKPQYQTSTEMRRELEWMSEVSAAAVQQKEMDFKVFRKNFFDKSRKTKMQRCRFKTRDDRQSFRLPNQKFRLEENTIRLEKIGKVPVVIDRRPPAGCKYMSVTVSKDKVGRYYASVLVEEAREVLAACPVEAVGIDLGLKDFLTMSTGEKVENPRWFRESQAELTRAQRHLSRKKKGSSRYRKGKLRVAKIHSKIASQRRWFHHQVSSDLVRQYGFIGVEDLCVKGMVRNRKLAKSISDAGWAQFIGHLTYKTKWAGTALQRVPRFYPSSKTCSGCGTVYGGLTLGEREWVCTACGCVHDRDVNAAENILREAQRLHTAQGVACA